MINVHLGSLITRDAKCTCDTKSRIAMSKSNVQQEEGSFHQQTGLKFKEETSKVLHFERSFVRC
jgi:hypothetical protein